MAETVQVGDVVTLGHRGEYVVEGIYYANPLYAHAEALLRLVWRASPEGRAVEIRREVFEQMHEEEEFWHG